MILTIIRTLGYQELLTDLSNLATVLASGRGSKKTTLNVRHLIGNFSLKLLDLLTLHARKSLVISMYLDKTYRQGYGKVLNCHTKSANAESSPLVSFAYRIRLEATQDRTWARPIRVDLNRPLRVIEPSSA